MKNVLLLAVLCLGACSASMRPRSLLSLRRRLATTPAAAAVTMEEMHTQLKVAKDRISTVKSMPANFLAVRQLLVESKKCIMANLVAVEATKAAIMLSKFYKPLAAFAQVAERVLKETKKALDFQDKKIASPVNMATVAKPATVTTKWTAGLVYKMEGIAKKNYLKVDKVDKKMKKVEGYAKKAMTAAAKAKKMWELVAKFAPKAGATGQARGNEAATSASAIVDPIVDFLKSMNANTKNMYSNIAAVATAVATAKTPIDAYKSAICKPKAALQKILDMVKPILDIFKKKVCLPCTCTKAFAGKASGCLGGTSKKCIGGFAGKNRCVGVGYFKKCVWVPGIPCTTIPAIPCVPYPALPAIPSVCTLSGCKNNELCTSAEALLKKADALFSTLLSPIEDLLKPLTDAAAKFVPDVPMPTLTISLPDFSALDTINLDFEMESLTTFADMTLNVDMNLLDNEANMVKYLDDCTLPQFLVPSSIESCANKGFDAADMTISTKMTALVDLTKREMVTIPTAVTTVGPIAIPKTTVPVVPSPPVSKSLLVTYVLNLKKPDGSEVTLASINTAPWYAEWKEEIITKFVTENALAAGSVVIESITQGSLIINFKVSGTAAEIAMIANKMKDPAALARLANEFATEAGTLDVSTSYTGTATATTSTPGNVNSGGAPAGSSSGGGAAAAVVIVLLLLIGGIFGVSVYMRKKEMGPFAAGKKLAKFPDIASSVQTKWQTTFAKKGGVVRPRKSTESTKSGVESTEAPVVAVEVVKVSDAVEKTAVVEKTADAVGETAVVANTELAVVAERTSGAEL